MSKNNHDGKLKLLGFLFFYAPVLILIAVAEWHALLTDKGLFTVCVLGALGLSMSLVGVYQVDRINV